MARRKRTIQNFGDQPATALQREMHHALHVAEKRPPSDQDVPPVKPFPGRKREPVPGQLSITDDSA